MGGIGEQGYHGVGEQDGVAGAHEHARLAGKDEFADAAEVARHTRDAHCRRLDDGAGEVRHRRGKEEERGVGEKGGNIHPYAEEVDATAEASGYPVDPGRGELGTGFPGNHKVGLG